MNYQEAIQYISSLRLDKSRSGTPDIQKLLEHLGRPDKKLRSVHITGTNGKGSTAAIVSSILQRSRYKVGLFSSPHIYRFNERIKIDGKDITDKRLIAYVARIKKAVDELGQEQINLGYYDFSFLVAVLYFADKGVDLAVLEVGMGGRRDPTKLIQSVVTCITNIDLEHTQFLGETKEAILREKMGIIRTGVPMVTGIHEERLIKMLRSTCANHHAPLHILDRTKIRVIASDQSRQIFSYNGRRPVTLPLVGDFQRENAAVAMMIIDALKKQSYRISDRAVQKGMRRLIWEGRMQHVSSDPTIYLDVAHNPAGIRRVNQLLNELHPSGEKIFVTMVRSKQNFSETVGAMLEAADHVFIADPNNEFTLPVSNEGGKITVTGSLTDALDQAVTLAQKDDVIIATGSFPIVEEVGRLGRQKRREREWVIK